ncbi:hypothetical protein ACIHCV_43315 [Streptomyces sp. NPDC051956]|uniref:hypothetical protein n=1 Tax=Streptomyces sp. NPDC051956 TaxID=3365677 RepID=UPI0037D60A4F
MGGSIAALVIAALGVIGTLASGLLTQRAAACARMVELEHDQRHRRGEEDRNRRQAMLERRHACYVTLNMADRQFHSTLLLYVDSLRTGIDIERAKADVEAARDAMREQWGEAQLVLSDALLPVAAEANGVLWKIYEMVRRIERGHEESGETVEAAHDRLREATRSSLFALREAMRRDLGVSALSEGADRPARRSQQ